MIIVNEMLLPGEELIDKTRVSCFNTVLDNVAYGIDHLLIRLWVFWQIYSEESDQGFGIDPFDYAVVPGCSVENCVLYEDVDHFSYERLVLVPDAHCPKIFGAIAHFRGKKLGSTCCFDWRSGVIGKLYDGQ